MTNKFETYLWGGIGEPKSNGGRQFFFQDRVYCGDIALAVTSKINPYYIENYKGVTDQMTVEDLRIRKITPKESFLLMGFSKEDYENAAKVNTQRELYKQAGNSIVVNVLEAIFKQML